MVIKHCSHGTCNSDSRYRDKPHMQGVTFYRFPCKFIFPEKTRRWINSCKRVDFTFESVKSTQYRFLCSKHFYGGNGPTKEHPDPIPAALERRTFGLHKKALRQKPVAKNARSKAGSLPSTSSPLAGGGLVQKPSTSSSPGVSEEDTTLLKDNLSGKLVIAQTTQGSMLPNPKKLLRKLNLPPNVMFKINARKAEQTKKNTNNLHSTRVVKKKELCSSSFTTTTTTAAEEPVGRRVAQETEVIIPEPFGGSDDCQDWIKKELQDYKELDDVGADMAATDFDDALRPKVQMTFECENEQPVMNIKTEPPDETDVDFLDEDTLSADANDGPWSKVEMTFECEEQQPTLNIKTEPLDESDNVDFVANTDNIKSEPLDDDSQQEAFSESPAQTVALANKHTTDMDHAYRRRPKRRRR